MRTEVKGFIKRCDVCQKKESDSAAYPRLYQPLPIPEVVWPQISMNFIDGLPKSHGCKVILVVVDNSANMVDSFHRNNPILLNQLPRCLGYYCEITWLT